ncbi:MAG: Mu-like prophage major head subunit gpT family protein, partial [Selenomonadaceae bacterium]
ELEKIGETGEFKDSKITEASAKTSIATYGRSFGINRQAIINDDMGALNRIPALYGAAARRMINRLVYKILKDNPDIEKAKLFHADHKNLGAGALSVTSLGAAKAAMSKQKNIGGKEALNIQPAYLIVPVDLETVAAQLISSVVDPSKNNATPNPFANKLSVIADPTLEEALPWYLAAAPGMCPSIEVTYLNGVDQPTMESTVLFNTLGIKWRIYLDFGVNLIDFRGLYKSTGE